MKRKILTEQEVCWGEINDYQKIDFDKIKNLIIDNEEVSKLKDLYGLFRHIRVPNDKNIIWYNEYIRDKYKIHDMMCLTAEDWYGQILKPGENSYKRSHINPNNIHRSPEFTSILFLQGDGVITVEYDDNIDKSRWWTQAVKEHSYFILNSSLPFFVHKNETDKDLIYLVVHYRRY